MVGSPIAMMPSMQKDSTVVSVASRVANRWNNLLIKVQLELGVDGLKRVFQHGLSPFLCRSTWLYYITNLNKAKAPDHRKCAKIDKILVWRNSAMLKSYTLSGAKAGGRRLGPCQSVPSAR